MASHFAPAIDVLDSAIRHSVHFREWLCARRWCGDAIGARAEVSVKERAVLAESGSEAIVLFLAVAKLPEGQVIVHLPLSLATARPQPDAFELQAGSERLFVSEAERGEPYAKFLVDGFHGQAKLPTSSGDGLYFSGGGPGSLPGGGPVLVGDSSNLVVRFATSKDEVVFKSYKIPDVRNREPEILERLHKRQFRHVPRFLGELALGRGPDVLVRKPPPDRGRAPGVERKRQDREVRDARRPPSRAGPPESRGRLVVFHRLRGRTGAGPWPEGGEMAAPAGRRDDEPLVLVREALRMAGLHPWRRDRGLAGPGAREARRDGGGGRAT